MRLILGLGIGPKRYVWRWEPTYAGNMKKVSMNISQPRFIWGMERLEGEEGRVQVKLWFSYGDSACELPIVRSEKPTH